MHGLGRWVILSQGYLYGKSYNSFHLFSRAGPSCPRVSLWTDLVQRPELPSRKASGHFLGPQNGMSSSVYRRRRDRTRRRSNVDRRCRSEDRKRRLSTQRTTSGLGRGQSGFRETSPSGETGSGRRGLASACRILRAKSKLEPNVMC